ncbi:PTS system lactose-specific IIB component, Lac family /PTS system lactose-specific IIC component, Lac family [Carnobacterium iners]|uniref:PTS system lactose-specific EIICB component n=1 Tax=Carnobacterium iners TaxID=1073423 RepID=A0A1X7MZ20_9LACT|nr:lactose-specific PTS transporter subunit EIIC [Carnobacterium iners]SEK20053.1 PTS system lactose-specific IIB component, Lac family /PTS system lactose-specific IIC component, Lac family [Carnobacterium iners]SMH30139.1 PTS system lactose-specific IIB component, Lac family /PTS system lactose-specific IIC component, Lac family [Carnobacterium iners]
MNRLVAQIEKMKPFFEKVSRNKYLRAVRDGFIAAMPVVLFSSLFLLIAYVPNIFGFYWSTSVEALLVKPYNYSMGLLGLLVAGTTAKSLADSFNRDLPKTKQINNISTMLAAIVGFLLLSSDPIDGGFASNYMGTTGLLSAFISAFIVVNVYNQCIKRNITVKMPSEVPPNIAQTFTDLIPFSVSILSFWIIDFIVRYVTGANFAQGVIELFQPLFTAADGYMGLALIYGAISFFWFIGIHGPSIVEPAVAAILYANIDSNLRLMQAGEHANNVLTTSTQYFIATLGGTGATLVVPLMFMFMAKAKQNRAIGKASFIPTLFGVNEPILFGAPLVLNPVFFIPFIAAPIANVWVFKIFVDLFNMDSFLYTLPWTTPAPIGMILGTGFAPLAFILAILLPAMDVLIYYPFFKVYDKQMVEKELAYEEEDNAVVVVDSIELNEPLVATISDSNFEEKNVLVLCAGGGTSGLLANALAKGAKERNLPLYTAAGSYGAHYDIMKEYDLIVLAPQVASNYEDIKKDTDRLGIKLVKTEGAEYISLTRDPEKALKYVLDVLKIKE